MLNFEKLSGIVKEYGTPLYTQIDDAGVVKEGEFTFSEDGESICVPTPQGGVVYVPFRRDTDRNKSSYTIGVFEATRDASGEYNGSAWTVSKGDKRAFAL